MYDDCVSKETIHLIYYKYVLMKRSFTPTTFSEQLTSILNLLSSKFNKRFLVSFYISAFQKTQMTDHSKMSVANLTGKMVEF